MVQVHIHIDCSTFNPGLDTLTEFDNFFLKQTIKNRRKKVVAHY